MSPTSGAGDGLTEALVERVLERHRQALTPHFDNLRQLMNDGLSGLRMSIADLVRKEEIRDTRLQRMDTTLAASNATLEKFAVDLIRTRDAIHRHGNALERHEAVLDNMTGWLTKVERIADDTAVRIAVQERTNADLPERFRDVLRAEAGGLFVPLVPTPPPVDDPKLSFSQFSRWMKVIGWLSAGVAGTIAAVVWFKAWLLAQVGGPR